MTSAYHFIEIYSPHTEYLGFSWTGKDGKTLYYKFLVMPFGLSSACYLFTKVTRPLVNKWRGEGKRITMFLDDGYGCARTFEDTSKVGQEIKQDLISSGFIPNATKCIWVPVQLMEFLGVMLNSLQGTIFIPDRRLNKVQNTIIDVLDSVKVHRTVHVKKVASLVGQLISMSVVIGQISQIMTRYLSVDVLKAYHWEQYIKLSEESLEQIRFWQSNLDSLNTKRMFESHKCTKVVFSDASSTGYAGYEVSTTNGISHGMWSPDECTQSSTWRELVAVYRVLQSLAHMLVSQRVK